jgi:molecular chaperone DnaK
MSKILGIDLGTTNSAMAFMEGGKPVIVPNAEGDRTTPSVVTISNGSFVVGKAAKRQAVVNPKNTIYSVKSIMGRKFSDAEVQKIKTEVPYTIKAGANGMAVVEVEGKDYTPQEISARVLMKLKVDAEKFIGQPISKAVITVPAYSTENKSVGKETTPDAAFIATSLVTVTFTITRCPTVYEPLAGLRDIVAASATTGEKTKKNMANASNFFIPTSRIPYASH